MTTYRGTKIEGEKPVYHKDEFGDITYQYRHFDILRDSEIKSGEYGSYKIWMKGGRRWFWNLSEALIAIDEYLGPIEEEKEFLESVTIKENETKETTINKRNDQELLSVETMQSIHDQDTKFIVCFSGGKDSIAMVLHLLDLGISKDRIILHHHEVDGGGKNLFDWKVTTQYCRAFADAFDLEILFSFREGGILREMYRENEGLQDILYQQKKGGEFFRLKSKKGNSTRRKFPAVAADLRTRWCSSSAKIDVLSRVMTNHPQYKTGRFIVCTGERRQESENRSKYNEFETYRSNSKKRRCIQWRCIIDWDEKEVWNIIERYSVQCHPCYELGWSRCSCQICIFSSSDIWSTIQDISPVKIDVLSGIEIEFNHTLYNGMTINEKVSKGVSFIDDKSEFWIKQATENFTLNIFVKKGLWRTPKGAFGESSCGSV